MKRSAVRELLKQFAENCGLRYSSQTRSYLGVCRGTNINASEFDSNVTLEFIAPGAQLREQIDANFSGFKNFEELGFNPAALQGVTTAHGSDVAFHPDRVILRLAESHLEKIGLERLTKIPDALAADMITFGAGSFITCNKCGKEPSRVAALMNWGITNYCESCWKTVQLFTNKGELIYDPKIAWKPALLVLAAGSILFGWLWGYIQSPTVFREGVPRLFPVLLFAGGFAVAYCTNLAAKQSDLRLRLLMIVAVTIATVGGNIWRTKQFLEQTHLAVTWTDAIRIYFEYSVFRNFEVEWMFLLGGPCGAWLETRFIKSSQRVRIS